MNIQGGNRAQLSYAVMFLLGMLGGMTAGLVWHVSGLSSKVVAFAGQTSQNAP